MPDYDIRKSYLAQVHIDGRFAGPLAIQLSYTRADPFALWITFQADDWCCARDLLTAALSGIPSGEGDVHIHCHDAYAYIELASPDGRAVLRIARDEAANFAAAALELVPSGTETHHVDVDAAVAEIFASTDTR